MNPFSNNNTNHVDNTNGEVRVIIPKFVILYITNTEATIEAVAKISELHFLFENAIPHRTPLKPNNPMFTMLRGNEHINATTIPIPVPRRAYNADILEHTNIPTKSMMPVKIFS